LQGKGFKQAINVKGGIRAWEGVKAWGPQELNLDLVTGEESPAEIIITAYGMEAALERFYTAMADRASSPAVKGLLERLSSFEERHKAALFALFQHTVDAAASEEDLRRSAVFERLEGGFTAQEFLDRNAPAFNSAEETLQLAMMLETQALDLYLRFSRNVAHEQTQEVLFKTADEEKDHLAALGEMLDQLT